MRNNRIHTVAAAASGLSGMLILIGFFLPWYSGDYIDPPPNGWVFLNLAMGLPSFRLFNAVVFGGMLMGGVLALYSGTQILRKREDVPAVIVHFIIASAFMCYLLLNFAGFIAQSFWRHFIYQNSAPDAQGYMLVVIGYVVAWVCGLVLLFVKNDAERSMTHV